MLENMLSHVNFFFFFFSPLNVHVHGLREENKHVEEEMETEKEEDSSDEEMESRISRPQQAASGDQDSSGPLLTKAEVRELRKVKKLDYSWFSNLLDSGK